MKKCKWIALILAMFMLLSMAPALAAPGGNPTVETVDRKAYLKNLSNQPFSIPFYRLTTGEVAYCLDSSMTEAGGSYARFIPKDYFDDSIYKGLLIIMHNGYPLIRGDLTNEQAEYATALAVWSWLMGGSEDGNAFTLLNLLYAGNTSPEQTAIINFAWDLVSQASNGYLGIMVDPSLVSLHETNGHLEGSVRVTLYGVDTYTIHEDRLPAGMELSGYSGYSGDVLTITAPMSYNNQAISIKNVFSGVLDLGNLLHWYQPSQPGYQRIAAMEIGGGSEETYADLELVSGDAIPNGQLKITKYDNSTYARLQGAVFQVYEYYTNTLVDEFTTDVNGVGISKTLPLGMYYYKEKTPPAGYAPITSSYSFYLSGPYETSFYNSKAKAKVKVIKTDADDSGTKLRDAVIGIYKAADGSKVGELVTDKNGEAVSGDLLLGQYYLKEIEAPPGYVLSPTQHPFELTTHGATVSVTFDNSKTPLKYGKVKLIKQDAINSTIKLNGAVFGIYKVSDNAKVGELTTEADGSALSGDLPLGYYYLKELTPPEGYAVSVSKYLLSIDTEGETVEVTIDNAKLPAEVGKVKLIKQDADNASIKLKGAEFGLYRVSDDALMDELTTNSVGTALSHDLPLGSYYLQEVLPPVGYRATTEKYPVELTVSGATVEIIIHNAMLPVEVGTVKLIKLDADDPNKKLSGAVFGIYGASDDSKVGELTTGSDGTATSGDLPLGQYYLLEITPPTGYSASTQKYPFELTTATTVIVTIENAKLLPEVGRVKLIKFDADDTGIMLSGAVFGIYSSADDGKVGELTTGNDGTATSGDLPFGQYYMKEITPPSGYAPATRIYSYKLTTSGVTVEISVPNTKFPSDVGKVEVLKVDSISGMPLKNAVFGIYEAGKTVKLAELRTGEDGIATSVDLPFGNYYIQELTAPDGYMLDGTQRPFTLKAGTALVKLTVTNVKALSRVEIYKKDMDTGMLLAGAEFAITKPDGTAVTKVTSDAGGVARADLLVGEYVLQETKAPAGYILNAEKKTFSVVSTTATVSIEVTNKQIQGKVRLIKVDDKDKPLSGAVFTLHKEDGTQLGMLTTGDDGMATSPLLPVGKYYLLEKTAPSGYKLSTEKHAFTIDIDGVTVQINVKNDKTDPEKKGTLEVYFKHIKHGTELHKSYSYTDVVGKEYMPWVYTNGLDKMPIPPYYFVRGDYPASTTLIDGKLVITYWYDDSPSGRGTNGNGSSGITDGGVPNNGSSDIPAGAIRAIPKTGEKLPWMNIIIGSVLMAASVWMLLWWLRKHRMKPESAGSMD